MLTQNKRVEKVALDARRREARVVRLEEDHADDVVADVPLPLQLLRIVLLVRQLRAHVEHDFDGPPAGVHRVQAGEVVHRVQSTLVLVEACDGFRISIGS